MPFGADEALKAQQAIERAVANLPDRELAPARVSAPTSAPASVSSASPPAATSGRARFSRENANPSTSAPSATARFQRPAAAPRAPAAPSPARPTAQAPAPTVREETPAHLSRPASSSPVNEAPIAPRGYAHRLPPARETSMPGLTPRLELYIDEMAFHKGWQPKEVLEIKKEACQHPKEAEEKYRAMFEEIRLLRRDTIQSLQQGLREHPNEVVFVLQRGENRSFSTMTKEKAGAYRILHGSAFHSQPASATLFPSPEVLFAPAPVVAPATEVSSDESAPADPVRPAIRSARP